MNNVAFLVVIVGKASSLKQDTISMVQTFLFCSANNNMKDLFLFTNIYSIFEYLSGTEKLHAISFRY